MNSRRISFVPSKIRLIRASRSMRSYGQGFTKPRPPASCTISSADRHSISLANTLQHAASSAKSPSGEEAARVSGIDAIKLRRRNLIKPSAMPYKTAVGTTIDSGEFEALLDKALALADTDGFKQRRRESRVKPLP